MTLIPLEKPLVSLRTNTAGVSVMPDFHKAMNKSRPCSILDERQFGPVIQPPCLDGFDFTLFFEESILTIVPLTIACLCLLVRVWELYGGPSKVKRSRLYVVKLMAISLYLALQLVLLGLWLMDDASRTPVTIPTTILIIIGFGFFLYASHLEHRRSLRPSTILTLYLSFSLLFDIVRCRTLWLAIALPLPTALFAASCGVKAAILALEATEKRSLLKDPYKDCAPEAVAGVFNRSFFWWLNPIFRKGFKNSLPVDSLNVLDYDLLAATDPPALMKRWNKKDKSRPHALLTCFLIHYKWHIAAGLVPRLFSSGFAFAQPFLVERVLNFIEEPDIPTSRYQGHGLIAAYAIVYLGLAISHAVYEHKTYRVMTMVRGSLSTMIFQKTLRVEHTATSDSVAVTHLNADVEWVAGGLLELHEYYSSILEAGVALWLLARLLNVAMVASAAFTLLCVLGGIPLSLAAGRAHIQWLDAIGKRVSVTGKVLGSLKAIRMTGISSSVESGVKSLRTEEIASSWLTRVLDVLVAVTSYASGSLAPVFGFGLYSLLARSEGTEPLTTSVAFSALTLFSLLEQPVITIITGGEQLVAIVKGFQRVQQYLLNDERVDCRLTSSSLGSGSGDPPESEPLMETRYADSDTQESDGERLEKYTVFREVSSPCSEGTKQVLHELTLDIDHDKTTMVAGLVGCGKSTFLQVLLGEISCSGSVWTSDTRTAYCSQRPWLTSGTIRENIVGASPWDRPWYDEIVNACALDVDFAELLEGDLSQVGVRGSRLSGGQQMRVALARALYSKNKVLILDDVLTGLDQTTAHHILHSLFSPGGMFKRNHQTVVLATSSVLHLSYADTVVVLGPTGSLIEQTSGREVVSKGKYSEGFGDQGQVSDDDQSSETSESTDEESLPETADGEKETAPEQHRSGDWSVYKYYFRNVGWALLSFYFAWSAAFTIGVNFPAIWLQWWTNSNRDHPNERLGYWVGIYAALGGLCLVLVGICDWIFNMIIEPKVAARFHNILLDTTMRYYRATTAFLTGTDSGKTLNRFSQDLEIIDMELSSAFDTTVIALLSCIVEGALVFTGSSPYVGLAIPPCVVIVYYIQKFYLRTSRQIRLLDIEYRAPLQSQILDVFSGLTSIRAYGWTAEYERRNTIILNTSQQPYYLLFCLQRWLNLVLDLLVTGIAVLVVSIATSLRGSGSTGLLGVALFNIVNFSGSLQQVVDSWTKLEIAIGALARIKDFVQQTPREDDLSDERWSLAANWPEKGNIRFIGVSGSYEISDSNVIENINLNIRSGEKVAVCGRTGSGKSSMILSLLRMLEVKAGAIFIDGVDISKVPRSDLRTRLNVIPQEPAFLHGSVRHNFDPSGQVYEDTLFEDAIRAVGLWDHVVSQGGLDIELSDDLFSHGQRQLFCLARGLCRYSSILIMDEATSSIDAETEELVDEIIKTRFQHQTVISVVHKLHNALDFDRIITMDKGQVVEFDSPRTLLDQKESLFKQLYENGEPLSEE